jgi:ABC-2 type transport system ATP-binding protein
MSAPIIDVKDITYIYTEDKALDQVSFQMPEGAITALAGPNGAGKSTLMRCLAGLDTPYSGKVMIGGIDAQERPRDVHRITGYLSDFFGLYDALSVRQCLTYFAWSRLIPQDYMQTQIDWLIDLLGLEEVIDKKAGDLSRGWRQRVGIAQSIIHNPKLLILDEPASGLDPEARQKLSKILRTLRKDHGMSILVSSHILAELEDYCDSMLILRDGKLIDHIQAGEKTADGADVQPLYPLYIDFIGTEEEMLETHLEKKGALNIVPAKELNDHLKNKMNIQTLHFEVSIEATDISTQDAIANWMKDVQKKCPAPLCGIGLRASRLQDLYMQRGGDLSPASAISATSSDSQKKEG